MVKNIVKFFPKLFLLILLPLTSLQSATPKKSVGSGPLTASQKPSRFHPKATRFYRKGRNFYKKRKLKTALKYFQKATTIDPGYDTAYIYKGKTLTALGRPQEALPHFDKAIKIARRPPTWFGWPYYEKGAALMTMKKFKKAIKQFTKATESDASVRAYTARATAYTSIAKSYFDKGNKKKGHRTLEKALIDMKRAVHSSPKVSTVWAIKAGIHFMLGDEKAGYYSAQRACRLGDCRIWEEHKKLQKTQVSR